MIKQFILALCAAGLLSIAAVADPNEEGRYPPIEQQLASDGPYKADWTQLDARPIPQWWQDAKFGIFIHWGIYSVPSYMTPGEYAEWYWERIGNPNSIETDDKTRKLREDMLAYHAEQYGDADYFDFATGFTAQMFDADQWAKIFKNSGAKYVVMVSKHHDGFALWPSAQASAAWGRPWNSAEIGPNRDLVGELSQAVRDQDLRFGLYYSQMEWFHPLYKKETMPDFIRNHYVPQFKDVVTRYAPEILFMDGEWGFDNKTWRAEDILAWLYNEAPSRDTLVVNDRWGWETRHKHGGYYTTEYGAGLPGADHPWEENRGLGFSYGFNRAENLEHYATGQELVLMLVDTVSRGGNLLINVGPAADGRIPIVFQDRLNYIGTWLDHNGEAIYGTKTWRAGFQWSAGEQVSPDFSKNYRADYNLKALTTDPKPGMAVKEAFFTRKGSTLYVIAPYFPSKELRIKDFTAPAVMSVSLVHDPKMQLVWRQEGGDLVIMMPDIDSSALPFLRAYAFKLSGALKD